MDGDNFLGSTTPLTKGTLVKLLLLTAATVAALLLFSPVSRSPLFLSLINSGHVVVFAVFSGFAFPVFRVLTANYCRHLQALFNSMMMFSVLAFVLSLAIELVQSYIGRDASWGDVGKNMAGVLAGLCVFGLRYYRTTLPRIVCVSGLLCALFVACHTPAQWAQAYYVRDRIFPLLVDFNHHTATYFAKANHGATIARVDSLPDKAHDGSVLKVDFASKQRYPGWTLANPSPDWRHFDALVFSVFSQQSEPLDIAFRINDTEHNNAFSDRFNRVLTIHPGANQFSISLQDIRHGPEHREINMDKIHNLTWFLPGVGKDVSLSFGEVALK